MVTLERCIKNDKYDVILIAKTSTIGEVIDVCNIPCFTTYSINPNYHPIIDPDYDEYVYIDRQQYQLTIAFYCAIAERYSSEVLFYNDCQPFTENEYLEIIESGNNFAYSTLAYHFYNYYFLQAPQALENLSIRKVISPHYDKKYNIFYVSKDIYIYLLIHHLPESIKAEIKTEMEIEGL